MDNLTDNQRYHLILADIAMAAAIRTYDPGYVIAFGDGGYGPADVRDRWLAGPPDDGLRRRVTALANAGVASLQGQPAAKAGRRRRRLRHSPRPRPRRADGRALCRQAERRADLR